MDYSSTLTISNRSANSLNYARKTVANGYWAIDPAPSIAPNGSARMQIKDKLGPFGSEGSVTYSQSGFDLTFFIACPTTSKNYAFPNQDVTAFFAISYRARSNGGAWMVDACPEKGNPLEVESVIANAPAITALYVQPGTGIPVRVRTGEVVDYTQPIWALAGEYADGTGSRCPAAFLINSAEVLRITWWAPQVLTGQTCRLKGYISGVLVMESAPIAAVAGPQIWDLRVTDPVDTLKGLTGDVEWRLTVGSGAEIVLPMTSRIELYWLLNTPTTLFSAGVWVTVLRKLFPRVNGNDEANARISVVRACFEDFNRTYDTHGGRSFFTYGINGFHLEDYMDSGNSTCNCFDQAAAVQVMLSALGVTSTRKKIEPCGFINTTQLVGITPPCNNPFWPMTPVTTTAQVTVLEHYRTNFIRHSFVGAGPGVVTNIYDACGGPQIGVNNYDDYLTKIIDKEADIYGTPSINNNYYQIARWGSPLDNADLPVIASVTMMVSVPTGSLGARDVPHPPRLTLDWRELAHGLGKVAAESLIPTRDGGLGRWILQVDDQKVVLEVFVALNDQAAIDAMQTWLLNCSAPIEFGYEPGPAQFGPGSLLDRDGSALLWVQKNVFVHLRAGTKAAPVRAMAEDIHARIARELSVPSSAFSARLSSNRMDNEDIASGPLRLEPGDELNIDLDAPQAGTVTIDIVGDLSFVTQVGSLWTFRANAPGTARVDFFLVHGATLQASVHSVQVEVAGA